MADHNERWVLNHLIEMCKDEELVLRHAADHVQEASVRTLLMELALQRARFAEDLLPHAQRLGGAETAEEGTTLGALHRFWMAVRDTLMGHSDRRAITEAEHVENLALATYEKALNEMLPPTARDVIERQSAEIRQAHDRVRTLLSH